MLVAVRGAASVGCSKTEFGGTNRVDEYGANFWTAGNSSLQSILALSGVPPWHPERDMAGSAIDALLCDPPGAVSVGGQGREGTGREQVDREEKGREWTRRQGTERAGKGRGGMGNMPGIREGTGREGTGRDELFATYVL